MDKDATRKAAEVMLAWADGEEVEIRRGGRSNWIEIADVSEVTWNWGAFEYRSKPKPLERWVLVNPLGEVAGLYGSKELAERSASEGWQPVLLREVTD